jgi:hypothetical protein
VVRGVSIYDDNAKIFKIALERDELIKIQTEAARVLLHRYRVKQPALQRSDWFLART